jgi:pimeloyl-ACP methyl ester carboxylesterase
LAIPYAARHPERVSNLILYGAFARGRLRRNPSAQDLEEAQLMLKLIELGWVRRCSHVIRASPGDADVEGWRGHLRTQ